MHYQYDSVNNSNFIVGTSGRSYHDEQTVQGSRKIPCIILLPTILFAAFVGHISTIAYIGVGRRDTAMGSGQQAQKTGKTDPDKAQKYAEGLFKENLLEPCQLSEKFYNNTNKEEKTMSLDKNAAPPPPPPPAKGCVATILIFRHCEAGVAREHCGYMGNLRSEYIATLFGDTAGGRWPKPDYIFAMKAGERHNEHVENWREVETIIPLSKKFNVSINDTYGYPERKNFVNHLYEMLRTGEMCGKLAVISWKHHDVPDFSHSLGCGPENGCPMHYGEFDYESVWQLTYSYHKERYAPYAVDDLSHHGMKHRRAWGRSPQWFVYGNVQTEDFDPLIFRRDNKQLVDEVEKDY